MKNSEKLLSWIRVAGLVAVLVVIQQLVTLSLFRIDFNWHELPLFVAVNFGIVAAWYYFRENGLKLPAFAVAIATFFLEVFLSVFLRAMIVYLGVFRFVAPLVVTFIGRQIAVIVAVLGTPQLVPAMLAALILLLLLPNAKKAYGKFMSNGFLIPPTGL